MRPDGIVSPHFTPTTTISSKSFNFIQWHFPLDLSNISNLMWEHKVHYLHFLLWDLSLAYCVAWQEALCHDDHPSFKRYTFDDQKLTFSCKFSLWPDSVLDQFARVGLWLVVFFSFGILISVLISDPSFGMHLVDNGCRLINKIK